MLLWSAVPIILLAAFRTGSPMRSFLRFSSIRAFATPHAQTWIERFHFLPEWLRVAGMILLVVALARPQSLDPKEQRREGIDIMLALDASGSMKAADFQPKDRMNVAKESIANLIQERPNDRFGLVLFAGEATTWTPLTLDHPVFSQMLASVEIGLLPEGTAIGTALGTALNRLKTSETQTRVIVLVTDGDNNAGSISPEEAARIAKNRDIPVYTILIGKGGPVPFPAGKNILGQTRYEDREIPVNPELLSAIASETGGEAYRATDEGQLDTSLHQILDELDRSRLTGATQGFGEETFRLWIGLGLLFLVSERVLRAGRWRRAL